MVMFQHQSPVGTREARILLGAGLGWPLVLVFAYYIRPELGWQIPVAYLTPIILLPSLIVGVKLARMGTASAPVSIMMLGVLYIVSGPVFDIAATLIHSPNLDNEANPIARVLLDGGHSVVFLYCFGFICQSLWVGFLSTLWVGLLRHRFQMVDMVRESQNFPQLVKGATGGATLTWRQWLFPLRWSEMPHAYGFFWILAVVLISDSNYRWYLGFTWFGLFPGMDWFVILGGIVLALSLYLYWLWLAVHVAVRDVEQTQGAVRDQSATG